MGGGSPHRSGASPSFLSQVNDDDGIVLIGEWCPHTEAVVSFQVSDFFRASLRLPVGG